jgi:hypothetical protein
MGFLLAAATAFGGVARAEEPPVLKTDFIEIQMPMHWECNDEVPKTCRDMRPERRKDALMSVAGKPARPNETLPAFLGYLKQPKTWREEDGGVVTSKVIEATTVTLGGQPWVSVIHDDSEVRGFRTRYMVTVKDGEIVVLTFTARTNTYAFFAGDFQRGVETAKLKSPEHKP